MTTNTHRGRADHRRNPLALMDHGEGGRHGDPLRDRLGTCPDHRFALGVRVGRPGGGEDVIWLVDELAELTVGESSRGKAHAFTHIIRHFAGLVRQLQTANAGLRAENTALHDEVQSLAGDLDQAREGGIGGVA